MTRRSVLSEAAELLADLVGEGMRTICFLRSRRGIELIQRFTRMRLEELGPAAARRADRPLPGRLHAPAAPRDRGAARRRATCSPSSRPTRSSWDRHRLSGRRDLRRRSPARSPACGRCGGAPGRRSEGLALYVAGEDALDQFFCRHPGRVPGAAGGGGDPRSRERPDPARRTCSPPPTSCRCRSPMTEFLGPRWRERAEALVGLGELRQGREGRYLPRGPHFPAGEISLRSASPDSVAIVERDSGELLGAVEAERAFTTVHPGAVYLHLGRSYEVRELDIESRRAAVDAFDGDWYTQPKKETEVFIEEMRRAPGVAGVELNFGEVSVTEQVMAYQRKSLTDHEVIDLVALDLPGDQLPDAGALVRAPGRARRPAVAAARRPARGPPCHRALPDRGAAAAGDVRPLGHRRPVDECPLPDRPADDLHLRRPPGRGRPRAARLREVRATARRRGDAGRRVPVRRTAAPRACRARSAET